MPFQSEKQRRFLHANHPEIAKRWERDYANGGILDIDASEEIISDDGNDIELTAYNAAFDNPNDLSTGVKTLFQAKDGGTPRRRYFTGAYGGGYTSPGHPSNQPSTSSPSGDKGGETNRERAIREAATRSRPTSFPTGDASEAERIAAADRLQKQQLKNVVETGPGSPIEKYDTKEQHLANIPGDLKGERVNKYKTRVNANYTQSALDLAEKNQRAALNKWGLGQLGNMGVMLAAMVFMGVPFMDAIKAVPKTVSISKEDLANLVKASLPVAKAKKAHIEALGLHKGALLKDVDITNPNEMVNLEETTDFTDTMNQLTELTATPEDDDTGGDGPELSEVPQVVSIGGESEQYTQPEFDYWGFIKERQAQKKAYDEKMAQENLMIQQPGLAYGQQFFNRGGLANLFRVKNQ